MAESRARAPGPKTVAVYRGASLKIIHVIYGGKSGSVSLARLNGSGFFYFEARDNGRLGGGGRTRPSRDLDRSPSFLPVYRSHAAMSNVVKIPLQHPINYLRFSQRDPATRPGSLGRERLGSREIAGLGRRLPLLYP